MAVSLMRALVAVTLVASGVLFHAASWQRWSGYCRWGPQMQPWTCDQRMDHLYEVMFIGGQWQPIGNASELAGVGLLLVASALLLLPWVLIERRPGLWLATAAGVAALIITNIGLATLRSGLAGEVVQPAAGGWSVFTHLLLVPTTVFIWLAILARGWARAAAVLLVLGSPLVALMYYANGSFDAAPWWEAYSGYLTALGGLCLMVAAVRRPSRRPELVPEAAATA